MTTTTTASTADAAAQACIGAAARELHLPTVRAEAVPLAGIALHVLRHDLARIKASGDAAAIDSIRLIEAWIFASAEPVPQKALAQRLGDSVDLAPLLARLKADYAGRGVNLVEIDGAWAFRTAADLGDRIRIDRSQTRKLSRAASSRGLTTPRR